MNASREQAQVFFGLWSPRILRHWRALPVPVLLLLVVALWAADLRTSYEAPRLLIVLNFVFVTLVSLAVALLFARSFRLRGAPGFLLFGCGALLYGGTAIVGVALARIGGTALDANLMVTVYNIGVWETSLCYLSGAALLARSRSFLRGKRRWLIAAYAAAGLTLALNVAAVRSGMVPSFFVPGDGTSEVRQFVLASTMVMLVLTAMLVWRQSADRRPFVEWFCLGLLLLTVGMLALMLQPVVGGVLGWLGRGLQYLAGAYMLVAARAALGHPGDPIRTDARPQGTPLHPFSIAIAAVLIAAVLRMVFLDGLELRSPFLTFYVAVAVAALYGGLGAGTLATVLSAAIGDYFWIEPVGTMLLAHPSDWGSIGLFVATGLLVSWLADRMERAHVRLRRAEASRRGELEREVAERTAELAQTAEELQQVTDVAPVAILVARDPQCRYIIGNRMARAIYEAKPEDNLVPGADGAPARRFFATDGRELSIDDLPMQVAVARNAEVSQHEFFVELPSGRRIAMLGSATPLRDRSGEVRGCVGAFLDITERKEDEERQQLLMREVDHRAKNALAVVQALVRLTKAETMEKFTQAVQGRVGALARAHSLLSRNRWSGTGLEPLISEEIAPYLEPGHKGRVLLSGPRVEVAPESVQAVAMVFHEMATNAAKYGALSVPEGRIEVNWSWLEGGDLRITWRESGGPAVEPPGHRGFGSTMIEGSMSSQLGGTATFDWQPEGLRGEFTLKGDRVRRGERRPHVRALSAQVRATPGSLRGCRILLIEDDPLIALGLEADLRRAGCEPVGPAGTLERALRLAAGEPDLCAAVVDLNLRGRAAWPVTEVLKARGVPYLIATGYGGTLEERGDAPVLEKPFTTERMIAALRDLLKPVPGTAVSGASSQETP